MILTPFGIFIRKYRIEHLIKLKEMADKLEYPSSFLSACETGRKKIPDELINRLKERFTFSNEEKELLSKAIIDSRDYVKFDIPEDNPEKKRFLMLLERFYRDLTQEDAETLIETIVNILENKPKKEESAKSKIDYINKVYKRDQGIVTRDVFSKSMVLSVDDMTPKEILTFYYLNPSYLNPKQIVSDFDSGLDSLCAESWKSLGDLLKTILENRFDSKIVEHIETKYQRNIEMQQLINSQLEYERDEIIFTGYSVPRHLLYRIVSKLRKDFFFQPDDTFDVAEFVEFEFLQTYDYTLDIIESKFMGSTEAEVDADEKVLRIREDVYELLQNDHPRSRFTIMHECGHIFWEDFFEKQEEKWKQENRTLSKHNVRHFAFRRKVYYEKDPEWQANEFAAEFLMPFEYMKDKTEKDIKEISNKFKVSEISVKTRLQNVKRVLSILDSK